MRKSQRGDFSKVKDQDISIAICKDLPLVGIMEEDDRAARGGEIVEEEDWGESEEAAGMEEDRAERDEAVGMEANSERQSVPYGCPEIGSSKPQYLSFYEDMYIASEGCIDMDGAAEYYRNFLKKTEKEDFLKVPAGVLVHFSDEFLHQPWLIKMLDKAVVFFELHHSWEIYVCPSPDCLSWFADSDSLILHLMHEHVPVIQNCKVWPLPQHDPSEERWCAKVIASMTWEPIDVQGAFAMLSKCRTSTNPHYPLTVESLRSCDWPLSQDPVRREFLEELKDRFMMLLASEKHFLLLSNGCLMRILAVASEHIFAQLDLEYTKLLPLKNLFFCSPLAFRFMKHEPLLEFVQLMKALCGLVDQAGEFNHDCDTSDLNAISTAIADGTAGYYFVLDSSKIKLSHSDEGSIASWLTDAPVFPTIGQIPAKASQVFQLIQSTTKNVLEHLTTSAPFDAKLAEIWGMGHWRRDERTISLLDRSPLDFTAVNPRSEYDYTRTQYHLELIHLTCKLHCLEPQVRKLCAIDLRMYILPLLRSFLRMKLYLFMNMGLVSAAGEFVEENAVPSCVLEGIQEDKPDERIHSILGAEEGDDFSPCEKQKVYIQTPLGFKSNDDTSSSRNKSEEYLCTRLEFSSISNIDNSSCGINTLEVEPMITDVGQQPIEHVETLIDGRSSLSTGVEEAHPWDCTSMARVVHYSNVNRAKPETDAGPQSQAESRSENRSKTPPTLGFELLEEPLDAVLPKNFYDFLEFSDSETDAEETEYEPFVVTDPILQELDRFMRDCRASENKGFGLFFCMTPTDVMKHCLRTSHVQGAQTIWACKANKTGMYWQCFICSKEFISTDSHMVHMECTHQLGLSFDEYLSMPPPLGTKRRQTEVLEVGTKRGQTIGNRIYFLDDSTTVDTTWTCFRVDCTKFFKIPKELEPKNHKNFENTVRVLQDELIYLHSLCEIKHTSLKQSEIDTVESKMIRSYGLIEKLKQELSNFSVSDYGNEIVHSVGQFLRDKIGMDCGVVSWASKRLQDLLGSISCSYLPDTIKIELQSPGKVFIYSKEDESGYAFAYIGLSWKLNGELSFCTREINGSFHLAGISGFRSDELGLLYESRVFLDDRKLTSRMAFFKRVFDLHMSDNVRIKLLKFQSEFASRVN